MYPFWRLASNFRFSPCCRNHLPTLLKPVHTGDYSLVADFGDNLSQKSATVAEFGDSPFSRRFLRQSPFSATVALFCNSMDRALQSSSLSKIPNLSLEFRRYLAQFRRYKYFRFRRPYCYFRLSMIAIAIICRHFSRSQWS